MFNNHKVINKIMKNNIIERIFFLLFVPVVLSFAFSSCDYWRYISLDCINQTSLPVNVKYSIIVGYKSDSILHNAVNKKVEPGACFKEVFVVPWGAKKTLCKKDIAAFEFETLGKSVRFEGPEEVMKIFSHRGDDKDSYIFFITDSLFVSKE